MTNGEHLTTKDVGGKPVTFRKLTMGDMCRLSESLHARNQTLLAKRLSALYAASGIEESKLPLVVAELTREPSLAETWRWLYTPAGIAHAAAVMAGVTPEEVDTWREVLDLAEVVQAGLGDSGTREVGGGQLPLSKASGATAAT